MKGDVVFAREMEDTKPDTWQWQSMESLGLDVLGRNLREQANQLFS